MAVELVRFFYHAQVPKNTTARHTKMFFANDDGINAVNMPRFKAAGLHFILSVLIAAAVVAGMLMLWYPPPFFEAMGGAGLLIIITCVDVVIGPLITLIIFNPKKKNLKADLAMVVVLQLAALAYGSFTVLAARPAYIVFNGVRFIATPPAEIPEEETARITRREFKRFPLTGPHFVGIKMPGDVEERNRLVMAGVMGADLNYFPQHYVPFNEVALQAIGKAETIESFRKRKPVEGKEIDSYLEKEGRKADTIKLLPLRAKLKDMTVVLDATSGSVLKVLAVDPW